MVGAVGFGVHLLVLWFMTDIVHFWYIGSATVAIIVAALNNYILNYHWTFKDRKSHINNVFIGYFKYLLSRGFTEGLYLVLLYVCVDIIGWHYLISAIAVQFATAIVGYLVAVKWIWKRQAKKRTKTAVAGSVEDV
jgi:putative flippase GtrA